MQHLLNGAGATAIDLQDRGLQYGDGLFETIAVREGRLEFWHRHMKRLRLGCQRLNMAVPDEQLLLAEARRLLHDRSEAVIKVIVTRGEGGRGYRAPESAHTSPNRIISICDWPGYPAGNETGGVVARYCTTPLGINPLLAGVKHLNRLEQVMARSEWDDKEIHEGLMADIHGHIVEGTMSNLFFVRNGVLHSPDLSNCGVAGIVRDVILDLARAANIPLKIGRFNRADINGAEELFVSNSLIGVWPLRQLEQRHYRVGPLTRQIIAAVNAARRNDAGHETV